MNGANQYLDAQDNLNRLLSQASVLVDLLTTDDQFMDMEQDKLADTLWLLRDQMNALKIAGEYLEQQYPTYLA